MADERNTPKFDESNDDDLFASAIEVNLNCQVSKNYMKLPETFIQFFLTLKRLIRVFLNVGSAPPPY